MGSFTRVITREVVRKLSRHLIFTLHLDLLDLPGCSAGSHPEEECVHVLAPLQRRCILTDPEHRKVIRDEVTVVDERALRHDLMRMSEETMMEEMSVA
jgi:hypothetical protein